jgi:hypothetical protein
MVGFAGFRGFEREQSIKNFEVAIKGIKLQGSWLRSQGSSNFFRVVDRIATARKEEDGSRYHPSGRGKVKGSCYMLIDRKMPYHVSIQRGVYLVRVTLYRIHTIHIM